MDLDQIQLNKHLCTYLRKRLRKTRNVLEDRTFIRRASNSSQQRALTEVDLVMKRAEDLESKCMCQQSSWLDAAITLADIKEEVLEIVLDLCFWTSMLKIATADSDTEESQVVRSIEKAVKKHEDLLQKLLQEGSSLQKAASDDRNHLLAKLEKVKKEHASRSTVEEYILSLYLWSRIKEDDRFAANVESKPLKVRPGRHLGDGASGRVSEVIWLQQKCALKVLKVVDEKEATILRGCSHPHIVRFLWYWEHHRKSHIVMEWMPADLYTHIEAQVEKNGGKPFQLHVAIDIMLQIAKAMRYLHTKKIVHRDLKTSNILVQPNIDNAKGYVLVKLADFGTSKFYNWTETPSWQTPEKGTTMYAAPEVFQQKPVRANNTSRFPPKADVWSFAMVCSEILTGKVPFDSIGRSTLHDEIKKSGIRPDLPPDCPRDLHFCITSCWELNPTRRPTFMEVCKLLKLAKAASLGITRLDVHKLSFSPNSPTLVKNRLDLNLPLTSDKPTSLQPSSSLLPKKFLHFGWTKRKTLVGENTTLSSWHID
jgi:serine/threonine protein kinase